MSGVYLLSETTLPGHSELFDARKTADSGQTIAGAFPLGNFATQWNELKRSSE